MTSIKTDVRGREIDLDAVDPLVKHVAITIAFGSAGEDTAGWWNHIGTAREVLNVISNWRS